MNIDPLYLFIIVTIIALLVHIWALLDGFFDGEDDE